MLCPATFTTGLQIYGFVVENKFWSQTDVGLFIDFFLEREGKRGEREGGRQRVRERETSVCCSTYSCTHWLILVCVLTRDQTHNLVV